MGRHRAGNHRPSRVAALAIAFLALAACSTSLEPIPKPEPEPEPEPGGPTPTIVSFTSSPNAIDTCGTSTLAWEVVEATEIVISGDGETLLATADATGETVVAPTATTTYVLSASNEYGSASASTTVTVTPAPAEAPSLSGLSATTVRKSRAALAWDVANAVCIEVQAAASSAPDAPSEGIATLPGDITAHEIAIPTSDRQTIRVCAVNGDERACATTELTNVVTSSADYDPYFLEQPAPGDPDVFWPEDEVPGTLRSVLLNAEPGAVIGFAADVTHLDVRGVDLLQLPDVGFQDAHLILAKDVIISGPPSGITLRGISAWLPGSPGDPFTYRSRMIYVVEGTDVVLEHLTITGGTFIYKGGGIRNDGTLTLVDSVITGNRAWEYGGGVWNNTTGTLSIVRSVISGNLALTTDEELSNLSYDIRGGFTILMSEAGRGGGLFNETGGVVTIEDSTVEGNDSYEQGGGLYLMADSISTIIDTTIEGNRSGSGGGGIHHLYSSGNIDDLSVSGVDYGSGNTSNGLLSNLVQIQVTSGTSVTPSSLQPSVPQR